jgi:photosystem II stability/assembly factor-like uncharacterized protein
MGENARVPLSHRSTARVLAPVAALGLLGAALSALVQPVRAGQDQWTGLQSLPARTAVLGLAVAPDDPSTIVAATSEAGLYRSTDGGSTWLPATTGLTTRRFWTVAFDPTTLIVYAGSQGEGLFRSTDRGVTWELVQGHLGARNVRSIAFGHGYIAVGTSSGVFLSQDAGATWANAGPEGIDVSTVSINASFPLSLLAGGDAGPPAVGAYLYKSVDGGKTWQLANQGLPTDAVILSLSAGPLPAGADVRPLLAGTNEGLFTSADAGSTWTEITGIPPINPEAPKPRPYNITAFAPDEPALLYAGSDGISGQGAGLWRSRDGGSTWGGIADQLPLVNFTALGVGKAGNGSVALVGALYDVDSQTSWLVSYLDSGAPPTVPSLPPGFATPTPLPTLTPAASPRPQPPSRLSVALGVAGAGVVAILLIVLVVLFIAGPRRRRERL